MDTNTGRVYERKDGAIEQALPLGHISLPHMPLEGCITCKGKGSIPGLEPGRFSPCPRCYPEHEARARELQAEAMALGADELRAAMMPAEPKANCKHCYGRGHIGQNTSTKKWRPCPSCYPGAAESELTPREIMAATEAAMADPEQLVELLGALAGVEVDNGAAADQVLAKALAGIPDEIVDGGELDEVSMFYETWSEIQDRAERDGAAHGNLKPSTGD